MDAHNLVRSDFFGGVITHKIKKRLFAALRKYSKNHGFAKKFMRKTLKKTDIGSKKVSFDIWKKNSLSDKQEESTLKQNMMVDEIQEVFEESGNLQN